MLEEWRASWGVAGILGEGEPIQVPFHTVAATLHRELLERDLDLEGAKRW